MTHLQTVYSLWYPCRGIGWGRDVHVVGQDQLEGRGEGPSHPEGELEHQLGTRAQEPLHGLQHERLPLPPPVEYGVEVSEESPERTEEEVDPGQETVASPSPHGPELQEAGGKSWGQYQGSSQRPLEVVALNICYFLEVTSNILHPGGRGEM